MQMNPLVKKNIKVQARSMRISWGLFAYEAVLTAVFLVAMLVIKQQNMWSDSNIYSSIVGLYPILAVTQILLIGLVVPMITGSAISGEKERQTFDIMMTTSMSSFSIVWGKVLTAVIQVMFYVVAGMPVMALTFVIGGLSPLYLLWFCLIAVLAAFFGGSIGVYCSSVCKKQVTAALLSYGFYALFFLVTLVPNYLAEAVYYDSAGTAAVSVCASLLLINPAYYMIEFFTWVMTGESVVAEVLFQNVKSAAAAHYLWMTFSTLLLIAISFVFLLCAAARITPVSRKKAKKLAQKNRGVQNG